MIAGIKPDLVNNWKDCIFLVSTFKNNQEILELCLKIIISNVRIIKSILNIGNIINQRLSHCGLREVFLIIQIGPKKIEKRCNKLF